MKLHYIGNFSVEGPRLLRAEVIKGAEIVRTLGEACAYVTTQIPYETLVIPFNGVDIYVTKDACPSILATKYFDVWRANNHNPEFPSVVHVGQIPGADE